MNVEISTIRQLIELGILGHTEFTLEDIDAHIGYQRGSWAQEFNDVTGLTPNDYARYFRMMAITWDLVKCDETWAEICELYHRSPNHLHRDFKATLGVTPGEFRELPGDDAQALRDKIPGDYLHDFQ